MFSYRAERMFRTKGTVLGLNLDVEAVALDGGVYAI